ncbi:eCIS core domain-containing protein [Desulfobulbus propionicus]
MLQSNAEERNTILTGITSPHFGHDFARIPLCPPKAGALQTKPASNTPGDKYELEADRAAEQVTRMAEPQIQRACPGGGGCLNLQEEQRLRTSGVQTDHASEEVTPPIVQEALTSPGQPLDASARSYFEPRFGQDFRGVRVHADVAAHNAARQLDARAFTCRQDVFFGTGEFAPETLEGRQLLAHELSHVVQQSFPRINPSLSHIQAKPKKSPPATKEGTGTPEKTEKENSSFPGFHQAGPSCAVASIVSALMIWDKEQKDPKAPNRLVETACNILLIYMDNHQASLKKKWDKKVFAGKTLDGDKCYDEVFAALTDARDMVRQPGYKIKEDDYQTIALCFYALNWDQSTGLNQNQVDFFLTRLGLNANKSAQAESFGDIIQSPVVQGLNPGQIAQVSWYVVAGAPQGGQVPLRAHAFLIGRFKSGDWFLSDQGASPPTELQARTLSGLRLAIVNATQAGKSRIYTGGPLPQQLNLGWTGVLLLSDRSQMEEKARSDILKNGDFLAEVDAGVWTWGSRITAGDFVARSYSLNDAFSKSGSGFGSVIVENPLSLFHVYQTNNVRTPNVGETTIDEADSKGGKLEKHKYFYHAWLRLCSPDRCNANFFRVF